MNFNAAGSLGQIRAISFDAGGTLIEPCPSPGHVYAQVAREHGLVGIDPIALDQSFSAAWRAKGHFDYSKRAWAELVDRTFAPWQRPQAKTAFFKELYDRFRDPNVWRVFDDVFPALQKLRSRGFKLAVTSNWDERLIPLLEDLKLSPYFEALVVSHQIGFHKPAPEIFQETARRLGMPPRWIAHVGDSESEDAAGAARAGMRGVLLSRHKRRANSISTLLELVDSF